MSTPARSPASPTPVFSDSEKKIPARFPAVVRRAVWPYSHVVRLFAHRNGQWAKKIRGRMCYFGVVADPAAALARYQAEGPSLHRGEGIEHSRAICDAGLSVEHAVNAWLAWQLSRVESGDLTRATFRDYRMVGQWIGDAVGWATACGTLTPAVWSAARAELGRRYSTPGTVRKFVLLTRAWAKWAECLMPPLDLGRDWRGPAQRAMRLRRADQRASNPRLIRDGDLRHLLIGCRNPQLRAMLWLGINCGFGQTDCATLEIQALRHLGTEALRVFVGVRRKTGVDRVCPLWPETAAALQRIIGGRTAGLVFVTRCGRPWVRMRDHGGGRMVAIDSISTVLRKEAALLGLEGLRFYSLRHTFRTIADSLRDQRAIDVIMGHAGGSAAGDWQPSRISGAYVESVEFSRLRAVSEHVRAWLLGCKRCRTPEELSQPYNRAEFQDGRGPTG